MQVGSTDDHKVFQMIEYAFALTLFLQSYRTPVIIRSAMEKLYVTAVQIRRRCLRRPLDQ